MFTSIQNLKKNKKIIKFIRPIFRNIQFKWTIVLSLFILLLLTLITHIEEPFNAPFRNVFNVIYWAVVTITTVGYGDITVHSIIAKILTVFLVISGVVLMSFMTATFASIFTATRIREGMGLKKIDLRKHIIICGFNNNIESAIQGIINAAEKTVPDIVLINALQEKVITNLIERFPGVPIQFVYGNFTYESTLVRASVATASSVIILADIGPEGTSKPDDRTLLAVLTIKSISKEPEVCAEVLDPQNVPHLKRAGVDQVVVSGEFSGFLLANAVMSPGIPQALRDITSIKEGSYIRREPMPHDMVGRRFIDAVIEFMTHKGYILVGIITEKKSFNLENVLSGETNAIDEFIRRKFDEVGRSLELKAKGRMNVVINPGREYIITEDDYAVVITPLKEGA